MKTNLKSFAVSTEEPTGSRDDFKKMSDLSNFLLLNSNPQNSGINPHSLIPGHW